MARRGEAEDSARKSLRRGGSLYTSINIGGTGEWQGEQAGRQGTGRGECKEGRPPKHLGRNACTLHWGKETEEGSGFRRPPATGLYERTTRRLSPARMPQSCSGSPPSLLTDYDAARAAMKNGYSHKMRYLKKTQRICLGFIGDAFQEACTVERVETDDNDADLHPKPLVPFANGRL